MNATNTTPAPVKKVKVGPGRPKYNPVFPKGNFTFSDFLTVNGVDPETGKGENCTMLTLRKWMKKDASRHQRSEVVRVQGELAAPDSDNGKGRKKFVFCLRDKNAVAVKSPAKAKTPTKAKSKAKSKSKGKSKTNPTADYEATKAALLAPAITITPDVAPEIAPAMETVAPETVAA